MEDIDNQRMPAEPRKNRHPGFIHPAGRFALLHPHADEGAAEKAEKPGQQRKIIRARDISEPQRIQPVLRGQPRGQFNSKQAADAEIAAAVGVMRRRHPPGDQHQNRTGDDAAPGRNTGKEWLEQGKQQDGHRQKVQDTEPDHFAAHEEP